MIFPLSEIDVADASLVEEGGVTTKHDAVGDWESEGGFVPPMYDEIP